MAYTMGMFGVVHSDIFNRRMQKRLAAAGVFLMLAVWAATPLSPDRRINYEGLNEVPVVLFVSACLLFGAALLVWAAVKESNSYRKNERIVTNLLIVPVMLWIAANYIFYMFDIDLFQYNYIFAIAFALLFLLLGVKRGVLGIKIRIEMLKEDASSSVLKRGSNLLNHAVKNEVGNSWSTK